VKGRPPDIIGHTDHSVPASKRPPESPEPHTLCLGMLPLVFTVFSGAPDQRPRDKKSPAVARASATGGRDSHLVC